MTQYVRNILKVFRKASNDEIEHGKQWYQVANKEAQAIASDNSVSLSQCVGVIAALSPNNKWERNLINASDMIAAHNSGLGVDSFRVSTYGANKRKAWSILNDNLSECDAILERLNGRKVKAFYSNIMGYDTCTIDGHALNIALGKRQSLTSDANRVGVRLYRELAEAYTRAAHREGLKAYEMQAITWTTWRRMHGIA